MNIDNDLSLHLYKANLELYLRLGRLLQENSRRWLELGTRVLGDSISESGAEVEQLLKTQDWQALASLPGDIFWRQLQRRMGDNQTMAQLALSAQTAFASGLQDALKSWQETSAKTLGQTFDADALRHAFGDAFKSWTPWWPAADATAESSQGKDAGRGAGK